MNLYRKCTAKTYCFYVIDATLASDSPSCFGNNLLERIKKLIVSIDVLKMKNDTMRLTEKQQNNQHYHLEKLINMNTGEEILLLDQNTSDATS